MSTREILTRSGLSQAELARRAGMPRSVVNAYVRGKREPGADALARLAAAGGLEMKLVPRRPPVDADRASRILVQVLELAEALPYRPRPALAYPRLADRIAFEGSSHRSQPFAAYSPPNASLSQRGEVLL